jgi:hypothetical protein
MLLGFAKLGTILGQIIIEAAMKFQTTSRALIAAAFLAALGVAPVAQAFTIQGSGSSGGQGFMDLDKPAAPPDRLGTGSRLDSESGMSTMKQGNTTFQFGSQRSFDQRYNTNNLFDPYAREGR